MRLAGRDGYTLLELMLGLLLLAFLISGLCAALLASFRHQENAQAGQDISAAVENLGNILKLYAVAPAGADPGPADLAALDAAMLGVFGCQAQCRKLPGDACPWALKEGCAHDVTGILNQFYGLSGGQGSLTYSVSPGADGAKLVQINASWSRP